MTMVAFTPDAPPPDLPPPAMRPGAYLQLRRMAAGLTIDEVAAMIAYRAPDGPGGPSSPTAPVLAGVAHALRLVEAAERGLIPAVVLRLSGAFPFDRAVYDQLVLLAADPASDLPRPMICGGCGCTWFDPCDHPTQGLCAWAETPPGAPPLCTICLLTGPANDA